MSVIKSRSSGMPASLATIRATSAASTSSLPSRRHREPARSAIEIALSGRKRSLTYLAASEAAACRASDV